jgi:hypothetical protein
LCCKFRKVDHVILEEQKKKSAPVSARAAKEQDVLATTGLMTVVAGTNEIRTGSVSEAEF